MTARSFTLPRTTVVVITALVILTPLSLIFWQSFLNAPFFNPTKHLSLDAYRFIFDDPDFWTSLRNSVVIAAGMVLIALPLGAALAFLLTRTDLPAQRAIEVLEAPVLVQAISARFADSRDCSTLAGRSSDADVQFRWLQLRVAGSMWQSSVDRRRCADNAESCKRYCSRSSSRQRQLWSISR